MFANITCPECGYKEQVKIGNPDEMILRIPKDEVNKIICALNHIQLTGDDNIDTILDEFNNVLKESI